MATKTLHDAMLDEMMDLYSAEKQLVQALPKMAKRANDLTLKKAIEHHFEETKEHVSRLEQAFESVDRKARAKKCVAMEGLLDEGKEVIEEAETDAVRDVMMIAAAQKVEHYEIASYGTVVEWARHMRHDQVVKLLTRTLEEERAADEKLTKIAEQGVNAAAQEMAEA
jgi:ferritin-like metal-binding protein YciE